MALSGFYYDIQKNNPLMNVTLHANAEPGDPDWKAWSGTKEKDDDGGYGEDPLCSALLNEDFSVAIVNNWSEFDGGNMLESAWNSIRPAGAYVEHVGKLMDKMVSTGKDWINKYTESSSTWAEKLNNGLGKAREFIGKNGNYLNHSLVVQGTRFSYYAGTGTSFSNLNMKFTLFADYIDGTFKTVHEQLEKLYPYIMGQYVNVNGSNKGGEEKEAGSLNEFFGWQKAPGGFKPDIKNIDKAIFGTLKLKFGSYYSIRNLAVRDAQISFSKQLVKKPSNSNSNDYSKDGLSPLYCDVVLSFQPVTKFSDVALKAFVEGRATEKGRTSLYNDLMQPLTDELTRIEALVPKKKN